MDGDDESVWQNLKHVDTGATGHSFLDTFPETMLDFIYDVLGYGQIHSAT